MERQIFISHTKKDVQLCDAFDRVCARVGIKAFRSEFEKIIPPSWRAIKQAMNDSIALFFLVGKELVDSQDSNTLEWKYTQNWIAYEMGLACQLGIDVWAICDDVPINFPMPYINNYLPVSMQNNPEAFDYLRDILEDYKKGLVFPFPCFDRYVICPHENCKMEFNLHTTLQPGGTIKCPQCLGDMTFPKGF